MVKKSRKTMESMPIGIVTVTVPVLSGSWFGGR